MIFSIALVAFFVPLSVPRSKTSFSDFSPFSIFVISSSRFFISRRSSMSFEPAHSATGLNQSSQICFATGCNLSSSVVKVVTAEENVAIARGAADSIVHLPSGSRTSLNSPLRSCIAPLSGFVSLSMASQRLPNASRSGFQSSPSAHSRIEPQISRNTVKRLFATFHTDWMIFVPFSPSSHALRIFFASAPNVPTMFCVICRISSSDFLPVPLSHTLRKLSPTAPIRPRISFHVFLIVRIVLSPSASHASLTGISRSGILFFHVALVCIS